MNRIVQIDKVENEVHFDQWHNEIKNNFPELITPAKIGMAMITQLLINDIHNAGAVVLVGPPSSGKTISINLFAGIEGLTYASDNFTAKAFVSGAANVSKAEIKEVDLLPKLRHKLFLVRDLAPIFSKSDEQLQEVLGSLTRILDGEGFWSDSGVHGRRGYEGDYLFFLYGATTPIRKRIWRVMGNLGPRILFYRMKDNPKGKKELIDQLTKNDYKAKEKVCNNITRQLIETLWHRHSQGIEWDRGNDSEEVKELIVQMAAILARLRAWVKLKEKDDDDEDAGITMEHPDRLSQWFYNLARGYAVIQGRTQIEKTDLTLILELAIDSGHPLRARLFRSLIQQAGTMTTTEIMTALEKTQTTALRLMEEFKALGIAEIVPTTADSKGRPEHALRLKEEWQWFGSQECQELLSRPTRG